MFQLVLDLYKHSRGVAYGVDEDRIMIFNDLFMPHAALCLAYKPLLARQTNPLP
jgi:hypothetical protein